MKKTGMAVLMLLGMASMAVLLVACGGGGGDGSAPAPAPTPVASFAGVYSGTYSGSDAGTVTVTLATNGSISGNGRSTVEPSYQFTIAGQVAAGGNVSLLSTGSAGTATFTGSVTSQGVLAGKWSNGANDSGTFTANTAAAGTPPSSSTGTGGGTSAGYTCTSSSYTPTSKCPSILVCLNNNGGDGYYQSAMGKFVFNASSDVVDAAYQMALACN